MKREQVRRSYFISLLWVSATFASISSATIITNVVLVDFIHGNQSRTTGDALEMIGICPPTFFIIATVGCSLVFGPPQSLQALLHWSLIERCRSRSALFVLGFVPFIAVLTWYCWDYLTPTDVNFGFNEGPERQPYQHGITVPRYLAALAYQLPVTLFSLLYCDPTMVRLSRRTLIIIMLFMSIVTGIGYCFYTTDKEYRATDNREG